MRKNQRNRLEELDSDEADSVEAEVQADGEESNEQARVEVEEASSEAPETVKNELSLVEGMGRLADAYRPAEGELDLLLANQLVHTAEGGSQDHQIAMERGLGAINLYRSFNPSDGMESTLARLSVALTNSSIDCLSRGNVPGISSAFRETELKLGVKLSSAVVEMLTLLDKHRQSSPHVTVGNVNVASGGRAIVGSVQSRAKSETESDESEEED